MNDIVLHLTWNYVAVAGFIGFILGVLVAYLMFMFAMAEAK